ncbi:MAG: extracellular solute-binding protein [Hyphomicrobium sp.]|uniref:extracellular solute-binding protein n=1 Tax=Hyphomicrobium sp. TaxID=82 RepID=UPI0013293E1F|nr:extracellular solute-binding protein [Hyphomicrobium sp.]KAB2939478.1 MAG: ABC transporter substrate-binding protein [Hyphomicrobium sp.]MBZ0211258.1 extracellular solute-binding protein [Hyphomicrobium sp.]
MLPRLIVAFLAPLLALVPANAEPVHGIALYGTPKQPPGFAHFSYVDSHAPKGGRLVLGAFGSFDSLNPLIVKGVAANGIRDFTIESLMARGLDEPFTLYGLIAESVEVPADRSSITFHLNPKARFSDGAPITADDVLFSFELLKAKGRPNHRTYFAKVAKAERLSEHDVRFTFDASGDREIPLILGLLPVLPKHAINPDRFENTTLAPPVGSGPYKVGKLDAGRSITFVRDPNYWGRDLAVNRGRFNFDEIRFDYFREGSVMFDAFKAGQIDLWPEEDPRRWANGYDFAAIRDGRAVKREFDIGLPAGMTALVFNTRRPVFADARVREALIYLFDFEWINRTLYAGLYKRTQSYFERSILASAGHPADAHERALLAPFPGAVKPAFMDGTYRFPSTDGSGRSRENQEKAFRLLQQGGYELRSGRLIEAKNGRQLEFEILAASTAQEGLLLSFARDVERLGIKVKVRVVDGAQYQARLTDYDYDMIQNTWTSSLSPGNEQLFRWSTEAAKMPGTYNFAGVENPAADAMIQALLAAKSEEDFVSAVHALDRVLLSGDYVVPLFFIPKQWVAYWTRLQHPEKTPLFGYNVDSWWAADAK